jgi:hypothetical protein
MLSAGGIVKPILYTEILHLEPDGPDLTSVSLMRMRISERNVGSFAFLQSREFPTFEEFFRKWALLCIVFALRHFSRVVHTSCLFYSIYFFFFSEMYGI